MKIKYISVAFSVLMLCTLLVACKGDFANTDNSDSGSDESTDVRYVYETKYLDCAFLSDPQKSEWKDALILLLDNEKSSLYSDGGDLVGYSYLYPDRPCIEKGYSLALFDINVDGTPELLVNVGGGSAGNAFYFVYDITTGKEIGNLDGGHSGSWCIYFNRESGKYEAIGQFEWRIGWNGRERHVKRSVITNTVGGKDSYVHETSLTYAYYELDAVELELTDEMIEDGCSAAYGELCTGVTFRVNGNETYADDYFDAQDNFTRNYIRIAETGIVLIDWDDVSSGSDSVRVRAEKMAQALISSDQRFLVPLDLNK